jgi:hypothetical protein
MPLHSRPNATEHPATGGAGTGACGAAPAEMHAARPPPGSKHVTPVSTCAFCSEPCCGSCMSTTPQRSSQPTKLTWAPARPRPRSTARTWRGACFHTTSAASCDVSSATCANRTVSGTRAADLLDQTAADVTDHGSPREKSGVRTTPSRLGGTPRAGMPPEKACTMRLELASWLSRDQRSSFARDLRTRRSGLADSCCRRPWGDGRHASQSRNGSAMFCRGLCPLASVLRRWPRAGELQPSR